MEGNTPRPTTASTALYLSHRHNPAFGWFYASELVRRGLEYSRSIEGDDHWLWEAYLHCLGSNHIQEVSFAQDICERNGGEMEQAVLKGLLLGRDATVESVAEMMRYPVRVVGAYERLFFNVLDRKDDEIYIANIVYPHGRIVEFFDEHPRNTVLTDLIVRAGFNNGPEDVLYLAGLRSDMLANLQKGDVSAKLEGLTIANGYVLARNGWQNQKRDSTGLSRAQALLASSKQNHIPQMNSPFTVNIGESLLGELTKVKRQEAKDRLLNSVTETAGGFP